MSLDAEQEPRASDPGGGPRGLAVLGALVAAVYLAIALPMLPDFGPTWDVTIGSYPYGEALLAWAGDDEPDFVEFVESGRALEVAPQWRQPYLDLKGPAFEWYKIFPVGAAASMLITRLLWHELGIVDPVIARHLFAPLATAGLFFALVVFLGRRTNRATALLAAALLMASPRFFTHSLTNIKDSAETVFYTLTMFAVYRCVIERTVWTWVLLGVATAVTLAQKANGLFVPFHAITILLLGLGVRAKVGVNWRAFGAGTVAFLLVYFAISPAFWQDPIARVARMFGQTAFISSTSALDSLVEPQRGWMIRLSPPLNAILTTPIPVLLLAGFGLFARRVPLFLRSFLLVNVLFPQARLLLPGTRDFDGVRHFLEFYPSLCALAGIGGMQLAERFAGARSERMPLVATALGVLAVLPGAWSVAATYPYGTAYFNGLVGGLGGAQEREVPQATDYWAASYWHGLDWLSRNAENGAYLYVPIATQVAQAAKPLRLREDIEFAPRSLAECDAPLYVMFVTRRDFYGVVTRYLEAEKTPVHRVDVQGGMALGIWRMDGAEKTAFYDVLEDERTFLALRRNFIRWILEDEDNVEPIARAMDRATAGDRDEAIRLWREAWPILDDAQAGVMIDWLIGISI